VPLGTLLAAAVTLAILSVAVAELWNVALNFNLGRDYELYRAAAARWLAGGPFYEPFQLAGPYVVEHGAILYPPTILYVLVPFTVLPAVLWWVIPLGVTAWCLVRLAPRPIAWPVLALLAVYPNTLVKVLTGNPVIWVVMVVALGTIHTWPAVFALLKPTLAPIALFGVWSRRWWFGLLALAVLTLPLASLLVPFVTASLNARTPEGNFYTVGELPLALIPITAWLARRRPERAGTVAEPR
jgi:hypothetical protein